MPDVTLVVRGLSEPSDPERLERALMRLEFVEEASANQEKELVAISYEGGEAELEQIGQIVEDAGYEYELSPGAGKLAED